MNKNKLIATGLLVSYSTAFLYGFLGIESEAIFKLSGLGMLVFGIWATSILYKS